MPRRRDDELGAHVSAAGGVHHAPGRARAIGSAVLQLFTKQPSRWAEPTCGAEDVRAFAGERAAHGIGATASHDSYLINLASPDVALRQRSIASFRAELQRCAALGIDYVVSHPGNHMGSETAGAIARNAEAVQACLEEVAGVDVLFETTAGTGTALGASFDELGALIAHVSPGVRSRVGVCMDTCHVWAAGYDIAGAWDEVIERFDEAVGIDRLRLFHLNDSLMPFGSRRDRHAHIGRGTIGDNGFRNLLSDPRFGSVPKVLETPKDDDAVRADRRNLRRLRRLRREALG